MGFEGAGIAACRRVEAKCKGLRVLIRGVESVAQVHEKCVAAPPEAILDV